jgi:predicted nuclease of restriction endonuclease-like (RecB) superfamily
LPSDYGEVLEGIASRVRSAQIKAVITVNREMILLYWNIGREILKRQSQEGWGAKVIERLSQDLKRSFPDMKGFSARSLKYMRAFAEAYPDEQIVQQLAAQIPWFHNCVILDKIKDSVERLWYVWLMANG